MRTNEIADALRAIAPAAKEPPYETARLALRDAAKSFAVASTSKGKRAADAYVETTEKLRAALRALPDETVLADVCRVVGLAYVDAARACEDVPILADGDVVEFLGKWYEVASTRGAAARLGSRPAHVRALRLDVALQPISPDRAARARRDRWTGRRVFERDVLGPADLVRVDGTVFRLAAGTLAADLVATGACCPLARRIFGTAGFECRAHPTTRPGTAATPPAAPGTAS